MKKYVLTFLFCFLLVTFRILSAPVADEKEIKPLENPISAAYLKNHLRQEMPRLIFTPEIEKQLIQKIKADAVTGNVYQAVKLNADQILEQSLLERKLVGRRLLGVARTMLYRMNMLGMVYRVEKDPDVLERINDEVIQVCSFSDWNPSHFLDVAEMSLAVSIAIDWTAGDLPSETIRLAKTSLIEKGIEPSFQQNEGPGWVNATHNWNQVCHGGMIAAALTIAEKDWELASKTINRAIDAIPHALHEYGPDGVYPEGATYWGYGTAFTLLTSSMLESALGTDFGIANYPAFKESAVFRMLSIAPSDRYYNFADCGNQRGENGDFNLAWFAAKTGNAVFFEKERFLHAPSRMGKLSRTAGAGLIWISQVEPDKKQELPMAWKGDGKNPIAVFRDENNGFYLGCKGGRATINHGNMDAGSFIFELAGVRWVVDPGNQGYHDLEKIGFDLWSDCQECERWTLLTKNNYGHSTLTVNNDLFINSAYVPITGFEKGDNPYVSFNMTSLYGGNIENATRTFRKKGNNAVVVQDQFLPNSSTKEVTWQLMTTAKVELQKGKAILMQDGKQLNVQVLSHPGLTFSLVSLDPPPLKVDRNINGLKRLELRIPAYVLEQGENFIEVELSGD